MLTRRGAAAAEGAPPEFAPDGTSSRGSEFAITERLLVACPEGVRCGEVVLVETADGEEVEVIVPAGVQPGDEFEIEL